MRRHTDKIRCSVKNVSLPLLLRCSGFQSKGQTQSALAKLGILVKIYIFFWDTEVFLCGICLLPEEMMAFFDRQLFTVTIYSDLVNRGVRLNDLISWKLRLFRIYFLHQNTCILGRIDLFLCLVK